MLHLFGTPYLEHAGQHLELLSNKPTLLLLYLAYTGEWLSRDALATLFQPEADEASAKHTLRVMIGRAKALAWAEALEIEHTRLRFNINTDVRAFREAVGKADWQNAVALHHRPLLENFPIRDAPGFEAWLELERDNLLNAWREACTHYCADLEKGGNYSEAANVLQRPLELEPLAEDVVQTLARNLYLAGKRDAALETLTQFSTLLHKELGLEPMQETLKLLGTVRRAETLITKTPPRAKRQMPLEVLRPPQFIGREHELETLRRGERVILIAGEPGVGKTRLLAEALPDARWLHCREGLGNLPYHPLVEYLKQKREPLPDIGMYRDDLARLMPELAPQQTALSVDPEMAKVRLLEGLARVLEANASPIAVDDLQWADAATLEFLVFLRSRGKVQLTGTYRSSEDTAQLKTTRASLQALVLHLEPFAEAEIEKLMGGLTGLERGPEAFSQWLYTRSGGNVFFALETLRYLFEQNALEVREGSWHTALDSITRNYHELALPPKISELMARRLSHLSETTQRTLQAASVLRQGFDAKLLSKVIGLSEWAVLDAVEEAEQAGMIVGKRFVHDVFRQGVYQGLSQVRCKALHARIAETLETDTNPHLVAEYWLAADSFAEAVNCWLKAAKQYLSRAMLVEAISILERALAHVAAAAQRIEILAYLSRARREMGYYQAAQDCIDEVLHSHPLPRQRTEVLIERAWLFLGQGKFEAAAVDMDEAGQLLSGMEPEPLGEESLELALAKLRSNLAFRENRFEESCHILEPLAARLRQQGPSLVLAGVLVSLGSGYDNLGRDEAIPVLREALEISRTVGAHYYQVDAANNLLGCLVRLGRTEEGLGEAEAALALGRYEGSDFLRNNLAVTYLALGREAEAMGLFEVIAQEGEDGMLRALAWSRLVSLYQGNGRQAEAEQALEQALNIALTMDSKAVPPRFALVLLHYGSETQLSRAKTILKAINLESLPSPFKEQYLQALTERGFNLS